MSIQNLNPGDIVVSNFGVYQHWSLVSDSLCEKGLPMLISATQRNGTVQEESWEVVTKGKHTYPAKVTYDRPVPEVLELARSQIGKWKYSLTDRNCEHFAKWATGLKMSSTQVVAGATGAVLGASLVGLCSENPKFAKFLGGALALGGLAVLATKAVEKK
ncbi:TPA: lecithin retinol acyltransferase family protein [Vibrio vulnificus]|nr:lecithin retinol acyltransferase family protein [Vibrio vulnificus]HDY7869342.1 lecithin retinol acyltransferase family protein [Vibrio vulnificus]HDY8062697.1 lecithin retinol acyltransferase family protein [Vibrio vulnificus]HDY8081745.1 lecithin retinol acyltransferase family protein [Vibrio vulnificus]HDY8192712.1 lecithin retinol acyltransferase family protein [Vibrio vulnificus]